MHINHVSKAGLDFIRLFEGANLSPEIVESLEKEVTALVIAPITVRFFKGFLGDVRLNWSCFVINHQNLNGVGYLLRLKIILGLKKDP